MIHTLYNKPHQTNIFTCCICNQSIESSTSENIRKLRYTYLSHLILHTQNPSSYETLLEKVALLYADLGYPSDMEHLIYYMPPSSDYNPAAHTIEQNRARLIMLLQEFLHKEELEIRKL